MTIDKETLDKISHLARLEFNEKDTDKMLKDMNAMIGFVEKLNEVNTEGIEPLTTMSHEVNMLREDVVKSNESHRDTMLNAPKKDSDYFHVPKVLE